MNPLRVDPSRTGLLRRKWSTELTIRFERLKKAIYDLIQREDAMGIVRNTRWKFLNSPQQYEAFKTWLYAESLKEILGGAAVKPDESWLVQYVSEAFKKGLGRAFDDTRPAAVWTGISPTESKLDFYKGTRSEFMSSSFTTPVSIDKIKLLAARSYDDLKGVTDTMATQMGRELIDGMARGDSPRTVARNLASKVEIGRKRALTIARTETVRAHAEGQLEALEKLGVEDISVMVEWTTSDIRKTKLGNPSPCPLCAPLRGIVLTLEEAKGLLPRHPNCMCSFKPANVGESTKGQLRTKSRIEAAILDSIGAERGANTKKRTVAEQKDLSRWAGADASISKKRPKSIFE